MTGTWQDRFRIPWIFDAAVASARPARGVVVGNLGGENSQVHAWDVRAGRTRPVTASPSGVFEGWIAPDGRALYWLADQLGDEFGHLARVPFEGGAVEDVTPGLGSYTLRGVGFAHAGGRVALNPVDDDGFHLYVVDLGPDGRLGPARRVDSSRYEAWLSLLSADGGLVACKSAARAKGLRRYTTLVFDAGREAGGPVASLDDGDATSVEPVLFAPRPGDTRLLAISDAGGAVRPVLWDPVSGARIDPDLGPRRGDWRPLAWSPDTERVLLCQLDRGVQRLHLWDLTTGEVRRLDHPDGTYYLPFQDAAAFSSDETVVLLHQDASRSPRVLALDVGASRRAPEVLLAGLGPVVAAGGVDGGVAGRDLRSVSFRSSDGQEIQAWLGVPDGTGPFPAILDVHGGPHWFTPDAFDPVAQAWLDQGFAWLSVNYRGSLGFGREFKERIWGDIGHWELEDMVAGRAFLVERGVAAPDAVFVHGASYGGYLTLLALGKRPELWAGGIAQVATVDWAAGYDEISPALRAALSAWFGGTPAELPEAYAASSPLAYAGRIQAPILVFQARHDSRIGPGQMETFAALMRQMGKPIEVVWWDGGHAYPPIDELIGSQDRALRFATGIAAAKGAAPRGPALPPVPPGTAQPMA